MASPSVASSATPTLGQSALSNAQDKSLLTDKRLDQAVSVDETGIALDELLRRFSHNGLHLSSSTSAADQKLHIRLKLRPLRTLMICLVQLIPGRWVPQGDGSGYVFFMSGDAVQRRQKWWDLFISEREQALDNQRAAVLKSMQEPPVKPDPMRPHPEGFDPAAEAKDYAQQCFFNALPPSLQEQIAAQLDERVFYQVGGMWSSSDGEGGLALRVADLPAASRDILIGFSKPDTLSDMNGSDCVIFRNVGTTVFATVASQDGNSKGPVLNLRVPATSAVLSLEQDGLINVVDHLGKNAPKAWKSLADYQRSRYWPNTLPRIDKSKTPPRPIRRSDTLKWLMHQGDIEFVSDYYSLPSTPMTEAQKKLPLSRPLDAELNAEAAAQDTSWKRTDGDILLFRDNRWYRDDNLEVPNYLLRKWVALYAYSPGGGQSSDHSSTVAHLQRQLDWEADIVNSLTPWQITTGLKWYLPATLNDKEKKSSHAPSEDHYPFAWVSQRTMKEYATASFYSMLTPDEREAVLQGMLLVPTLDSRQKTAAGFLVPMLPMLMSEQENRSLALGLVPHNPGITLFDNAAMAPPEYFPDVRLTVSVMR